MKFDKIKVGDTVYKKERVAIPNTWGQAKQFEVPIKVTRITNTQFTTEDGYRYQKKHRSKIGGRSFQGVEPHGEDQTKEMKLFARKMNRLSRAINHLRTVKINENTPDEVLTTILNLPV